MDGGDDDRLSVLERRVEELSLEMQEVRGLVRSMEQWQSRTQKMLMDVQGDQHRMLKILNKINDVVSRLEK